METLSREELKIVGEAFYAALLAKINRTPEEEAELNRFYRELENHPTAQQLANR